MGTGSKCIGRSKMSNQGTVLVKFLVVPRGGWGGGGGGHIVPNNKKRRSSFSGLVVTT